MPDLETLLKEAQQKQKDAPPKKFSRGNRPDRFIRDASPAPVSDAQAQASTAIAESAAAKSTIAQTQSSPKTSAAVENATASFAIAEPATASFAAATPAIEKPAQAEPAIASITKEHSATAKDAVVISTSEAGGPKKSTQAEFAIAKSTIAALADKKHGYTRIDNYVFDSLLPQLADAGASIVYLYLWRRTIGFQRISVDLSHQIIADAVGLSKRTVQDAIYKLNEKGLIRTVRAYSTAIPQHFIQKPWATGMENDAIADTAVEASATATAASTYSENRHAAIAEAATNKRNSSNKENKTLSLPEALRERLAALTEAQAEREKKEFFSLSKQFPGEENEIIEALLFLEATGRDLSGQPLRSAIGLLRTNYPQIRNYLREQKSSQGALDARRKFEQDSRAQEHLKAQLEVEEFRSREVAFVSKYPDASAQEAAIEEWAKSAPWIKDKRGVLARQFAINAWASQHEDKTGTPAKL